MGSIYDNRTVLIDLEVDSDTLSIDEINNRVGIGTTSPDSTLEVLSTSTQQKWSYDADSFATLTVANASHTTIATGETGDLILDAADDIILDSHAGKWRMKRNGTLTNMISATAADGSKMVFDNQVSNAGYDFKCSDGGVGITALSIDAANAGAATFNNKVTATELDISGNIDVDGISNLDNTDIDGTFTMDGATFDVNATGAVTVDGTTLSLDGTDSTNLTMTANSSSAKALTIDAVNSGSGVASITLGTTSGTAVSIGHTTSETTVNDNLTVTGDLTVNGTQTTINSTTLTVDDKVVVIASGAADSSAADGAGISVDGASATFLYDHTGTQWEMNKPLEVTGNIATTGEVLTAKVSFTDGDDAITIADGGAITANVSLTLASGSTVTAIKDEDNMSSDSATSLVTQQSVKAYIDSTVTAQDLDVTSDSGTIAIDLDSETLTIAGGTGATTVGSGNGITVNVDAAQAGITSVTNAGLALGRDADNQIKFATDDKIIFRVAGADGVTMTASGEIEATSLDIEGDVDINGTSNLDNTDIDGTFQMDGTTFDVNASGLVTVDGAGVSIDSAGVAANFTVASDGDAEDLTIAVTGSTDSSIVISSTGTGADAINIDTTVGSIDIDSADNITIDADDDVAITSGSADGLITLHSAHTAGQAILIDANANAGSILDIEAGILDIDVQAATTIDAVGIALGAGSGELDLTTTGTLDINANAMDMDLTDSSSITITSSEAAEDLTIEQVGANDSSIIIQAAGNGTDAIKLNASAGSIDIDSGDNITIDAVDDVAITSGSADGLITLHSAHTAGQSILIDASADAGSILDIDAGILDIDVDDAITIDAADEIVITTGSADGHIALVSAHTAGVALHIDADANAGSIVDIDAGILDIDVTGAATIDAASLTITTDTATFTSANSQDPVVQIKNTTNDANGARLQFVKDKGAAGAANDVAGIIEFVADDANQDQVLFGAIISSVKVHTNGQEGGRITLDVASHDGEIQSGIIIQDGDAEDEIDVTLGNGPQSVTNTSGKFGVYDAAPTTAINVINDYHAVTFETQLPAGAGGGRVLRYNPGTNPTLVLGGLYFLQTTGIWTATDANAVATGATQLLGVAVGTDPQANGLLMEGFIRVPSTEILNTPGSGLVDGLPVYVSTTAAHLDFTAPSGGSDFVRIVGHAIDDDSNDVLIYVNPSNNHVEL